MFKNHSFRMSESSTTWFDLPTEVKDQTLEHLFAGRLVLYGRMLQATDTLLAILTVSKQFSHLDRSLT